jgi:head-tail adaptor
MNAGALHHRPVFQTATLTQSGSGAEAKAWPPDGGASFTEQASFQYVGGREFPGREKLYEQTTARVIVRYSSRTSPVTAATHRILYDGKIWNILGAIPDDHKTQLTIEVSEIQ